MLSYFKKFSTRPRRVAASLARAASVGAFCVLGLWSVQSAHAQTPPEQQTQLPSGSEPLPRDYQNQLNPFPYGWGDAQNRGWSPDMYWGILQGNVPYSFQPMSRVPNAGSNPNFLELDGWGFPRGASLFGAFLTRPSASVDPTTGTPGSPNPAFAVTGFATQWQDQRSSGQPSTINTGAQYYYRSVAQPRLNITAQAVAPAQRFVYDMRSIPYATATAGTQQRFQVRVSIPNPNGDTTANGNPENRVSDARYVVYYYVPTATGFYAKSKVYTVSQLGGGEEVLTNADGNAGYIPFFVGVNANAFATLAGGNLPNQPDLGVPFQGVIVDNTTTDTGQNLYVLADQLQLVPSVDATNATPTTTVLHSGRRARTADQTGATYQYYAPGAQPYQPKVGPNYSTDRSGTTVGTFVNSPTNERYNYSSDFINDPFDPRYDPNSTAYDPDHPFEAWNPPTLFRGPESLIDPRLLSTTGNLPTFPIAITDPLPGNPVGPGSNNRPQVPVVDPITGQTNFGGQSFVRPASSIDANNNDIYRQNRRAVYQPDPTIPATFNPAVPYFSQMQVIVARTEYVIDPETNTPDANKDGTLTLQVGAIFGLDWQTGTPIWRFPDRTYSESRTSSGGYRANYRNEFVPATANPTFQSTTDFSQAARSPLNPNVPLYQVPGIIALDKNGDGIIQDDEVFITSQGGNTSGGLFAPLTYSPRVKVLGDVRLPLYRTAVDTNTGRLTSYIRHADEATTYQTGTNYATTQVLEPGRYATRNFQPVEAGVVFVPCANGVVYALDPYGNNDNDYIPNLASPIVNQPDYRTLGTFRPGTTNVLWTFSATNTRQGDTDGNGVIDQPRETTEAYNRRLKKEIPGTQSFGASSAVLAYQRDGGDFSQTAANGTRTAPFDWVNEEQRLFVGNANGVIYAMDAAAYAGNTFSGNGTATGVQSLPIRKERYRPVIGYLPPAPPVTGGYITGAIGLKWWFQTFSGGINAAGAVSQLRQDAGTLGTALASLRGMDSNRAGRKGVFFTSLEGRVYSLDWGGPVTKYARNVPLTIASGVGNSASLAYDEQTAVNEFAFTQAPPSGAFTGGTTPDTLAEALNDGWYFHNTRPATSRAIADQREGTVRPRWTYPNLYQDIDSSDNTRSQPADNAVSNGQTNPAGETIAGVRLATGSTTIGEITTPPVLIDFPFQNVGGQTRYRSLLAFVAPDYTTDPNPTQSRLYILDQVGDRANFVTNPRLTGPQSARRVSSYPRDRWSPGVVLAEATPAVAYRMVYDRVNGSSTSDIDMARRNSPVVTGLAGNSYRSPLLTTDLSPSATQDVVPGRRVLPTLYLGGIGRMYAIDFDIDSGLLMRWRPASPTSSTAQVASYSATAAFTPMPRLRDFTDQQQFAPGAESVQNRLSPVDYTYAQIGQPALALSQVLVRTTQFYGPVAQVTHVTVTEGPKQNRSSVQPSATISGLTAPTVPLYPAGDVPYLALPYVPLLQASTGTTINDVTRYDFGDLYATGATTVPQRGIARRVNQDVDDPLSTNEGYRSSIPGQTATSAAARLINTAYQYPLLLVTDIEGYLHAISSNTEGEDYQSDTAIQHPVGWAIVNFNDTSVEPISSTHTLQFTQQGPGGLSGVAVVSPAYLPSLDPAYSNADRVATNPTDGYRNYPYGEPNTTSPTPYRLNDTTNGLISPQTAVEPVANNDDPRPSFRPRSFSPGRVGNSGPDGIAGNSDDVAAVPADWHTGQTGFPLDLNGLFFDKRFAGRYGFTPFIQASVDQPANGANGAAVGNILNALNPLTGEPLNEQNPNGDYRIKVRLPGYSYIGGLLLTTGASGLADANGVPYNDISNPTPGTGLNPNNQVPDGARVAVDATTTVGNSTGSGNLSAENDDINPAGQNAAWIFAGGQNGLVYAFTPSLPGQSSGFAAGTPIYSPDGDNANGDAPKIAVVTPGFYNNVIRPALGNGNLPDDFDTQVLANSVARSGGKNFYEWGETVYIVVYDLSARTRPARANQYFVDINRRITLDFVAENVNTTAGRAVVQQARVNGQFVAYRRNDPDRQPLGIAVYEYRLTGNPSSSLPQTPGASIRVSATPEAGRVPGRYRGYAQPITDPTGLGVNADNYFAIANPLAVQGVLVNTADGVPLVAANQKETQNAIGPFESQAGPAAPAKQRVKEGTVTANTDDPDTTDAHYAQALTNGNEVQRRILSRFTQSGTAYVVNPRFNQTLVDSSGVQEPTYYMPVMASAGYIGHGSSGTTDTGINAQSGATQQNLRIINRSQVSALSSVRTETLSSGLFRAWPGRVPNAVGDLPATATTTAENNNNPRYTPAGMDVFGRINPLPWEALSADVRPWAADSPVNNNPDYPDIVANTRSLKIAGPGGDLTAGAGTLTAQIVGGTNTTVGTATNPNVPVAPLLAIAATVAVPKYQAANLVATQSLTSTFVAPSSTDATSTSGTTDIVLEANDGLVQLPRASGTGIPRQLVRADNQSAAITPFGYTMAMRVYAGSPSASTQGNRSAILRQQSSSTGLSSSAASRQTTAFATGAYRDFEIDFGVPVDMRLEVAGKGTDIIDLGTLGQGFGVDNGLLGYGLVGSNAALYAPGILPPPLVNLTAFASSPYNQFFSAFTVRNEGNVNLYNLRASQRSQVVVNNTVAGYKFFGMQSPNIDPRFAIGSVSADVLGAINNQLPQVVTSLDPRYDAAWDAYFQTLQPLAAPIDANTPSPYALYYQQFAGRHTLHKARVGADRGSVLSVPDIPSATYLRPDGSEQSIAANGDPRVGMAIPIGTPSAVYTTPEVRSGDGSSTSQAILGQSLVVFEDHDAGPNNIYQAVPVWNNGVITPAGPLYNGQNVRHPGNTLTAGNDNLSSLYSLWRVRGINGNTPQYQPYTERGLPLRVVVADSPLTGDVPDRASRDTTTPSIAHGRLPGIDAYPIVDRSGNLLRPAQALAPAAYRDANGNMNVYFARNVITATDGTPQFNLGFAQPGQNYNLFYSQLKWDAALGTWRPNIPGQPIATVATTDGGAYTGGAHWFSTPQPIGYSAGSGNQSNIAPFVLDTRPLLGTSGGASLFALNNEPIGQGQTYSQIMVAPLDQNGIPGAFQPFLANYDASVARFGPRAIYAPFATQGSSQVNAGQTVVVYYGGNSGRYNLLYSIRSADTTGLPTGTAPNAAGGGQNRESVLPVPTSISAASDPMPVYRFLQVPIIDAGGNYTGIRPAWVVDVYYTGISRTNQVPSLYMNRYEVRRNGGRFGLTPLALPRVLRDALTASAREPIYTGKHIDWARNTNRRLDLPVIYIGRDATGNPIQVTDPTKWRYDDATGFLYQGFTRNLVVNGKTTATQNVVYVDAAAGTVRFRGLGIPRRTEDVLADYQPSAYRISQDGQANQAPYAFVDSRPIADTLDSANQPSTANIIRRVRPFNTSYVGVGRQWLFWQKGPNTERGGALVYTIRRVGIDLKSVAIEGRMASNDSIQLSNRDNNGNQYPLVNSVTIYALDDNGNRQNVVTGTPTSGIAYEVDPVKGRIYVEPQYEGLYIEVVYQPTSGAGTTVTARAPLTTVNELAETTTQPREVLVPLRRVVNEIQPYAFIDTFDPTGGGFDVATGVVSGTGPISRGNPAVPAVAAVNPANGRTEFADPNLQPGRVWLFWSSPRGRQGTSTLPNGQDAFPGGYDLYWQTLAPNFDPYLAPTVP